MAGSVKRAGLLYNSGLSIPDVASILGIARSTARSRIIASGVPLRSRADGVRFARHKLGSGMRGRSRQFSEEHKKKISESRTAWGEANAVGVSVKPTGYIEHTRGPNKGRGVHVTVMELRLGRHLLADEVVHHIDGDRSNNDPDNLALMTRSGHTKHHRTHKRKTT